MIRLALLQRARADAAEAPHEASIEAKAEKVLLDMGGLARTDIPEAVQDGGSEGIVVADHRDRTFQAADDASQLPSIEQLPVRQMNIRERDIAHAHQLRDAQRDPAGHPRLRKGN